MQDDLSTQGPSINHIMESPKPACQPQTWNRAVGSFLWPSLFFKGVYNVGITLFGLRKFLELAGADDVTSDLVSAILALPACVVSGLSRYDDVKQRSEQDIEWIFEKGGYTPPTSFLEARREAERKKKEAEKESRENNQETNEKSDEKKYEIEWEKYSTWGYQNIILRLMWTLMVVTCFIMIISTGMFAYLGAVTFINEPYKWISRSQHIPFALEIGTKIFAWVSAFFNMYTYFGYSVRRAMEGGMAITAYIIDPKFREGKSGPVFLCTALIAIPMTIANFMNGYFYSKHSFKLLPGLSALSAVERNYLAIVLRVFGVIFKLSSRVFSVFKFLDKDPKKNESKIIPNNTSCIGSGFFKSILLFAAMDMMESVIGNFVSTNTLFGDFNINIFSWPLYATVLMIIAMVVCVNLFEGFAQYTYTDVKMLKTATRLVETTPKKSEREEKSKSLESAENSQSLESFKDFTQRNQTLTDRHPLLPKSDPSPGFFCSWFGSSTHDESKQSLPIYSCCFK